MNWIKSRPEEAASKSSARSRLDQVGVSGTAQADTKVRARSAGQENVRAAAAALFDRIQMLIADPELRETISFVLDNKYDDERVPDDNLRIEEFYEEIRKVVQRKPADTDSALKFLAATITAGFEESARQPIASALRTGVDGEDEIFVSRDLGFASAIVAVHSSFSDFVVKVAREKGVEVQDGDVGAQIFETLTTRTFPTSNAAPLAPEIVTLEINGAYTISAVPRYNT